jgi:hypothetical protein
MDNCIKCNRPIPVGQEIWMRRKSTNENVAFCPHCAQVVQRAIQSKERAGPAPAPPATLRQSPPAPPGATSSSNAIPLSGVLILFLIMLVGAPLIGAIVAFIGQYLYLIIAFPIGAGAAAGFVMAQGVTLGKVRDALVVAVLGLFTYGSYRYVAYLMARNDARADILEEWKAIEAEYEPADIAIADETAIADEIIDEILLEETGRSGFLGMVLLDAQEGMSVSPARSSYNSEGVNIGTTLTWLYWLLEVVIVAGVPAFMASEATKRPFCEYHDRWYAKEKSLGGVEPAQAENTIGLLQGGEYLLFGKSLHQKVPIPGVAFFIERCVGCQESNPVLTIKTVKRTSQNRVSYDVWEKQSITPAQGEQILESVYATVNADRRN